MTIVEHNHDLEVEEDKTYVDDFTNSVVVYRRCRNKGCEYKRQDSYNYTISYFSDTREEARKLTNL